MAAFNPNIGTKRIAFEYLIQEFIHWFHAENPNKNAEHELNKLKLLKLLFFASAVEADKNSDGLLGVFNNFYAMPYGHVESDVYNELENLPHFELNKQSIIVQPISADYFNTIQELIPSLVSSINALKKSNPSLINYSSLELVDLSHEWQSWKTVYSLARKMNKHSLRIPNEMIKSEEKFFNLSSLKLM